MDGFYNGPIVPVWVAFAITVVIVGMAYVCLTMAVRMLRQNKSVNGQAVAIIGLCLAIIGVLWMPTWFIYGVVTSKFH